MPVALYFRVSTEEQRERQSILTQREFADRYCSLHQLTTFRVYADDGVSGTVPIEKRSEGNRIFEDARLRRFDQLLIYKLDRLGRDTRLILNAVAELEKLGVRVRSMTEDFDTGTATGRLMLTLLSGFAAHERDTIRERSLAGTNRLAEAGAWMGGIVPYGYRKEGEKKDAHLVVSTETITGLDLSEADVIKKVFGMAAVQKRSCRAIADYLNELGIPCAYARDERLILRGKRRQRTSGIWRPGRVRGLITNSTYMGVHQFGKRSAHARAIVSRSAPAIVTKETWNKAQVTLKKNFLFGKRNARNRYLLRGLIKCGLCGLTYIGTVARRPSGNKEFYYRCNGAHSPTLYPQSGRCKAKAVRGDQLERQVWADLESFLSNPGAILEQIRERLYRDEDGAEDIYKKIKSIEGLLGQKVQERSRILALYRRGRLSDGDLDEQMDDIGNEEADLQSQLAELKRKTASASPMGAIDSAKGLLSRLREQLGRSVDWQKKRRLIEILVSGIQIDTEERDGVRRTRTTVSYRFSEPSSSMALIFPFTKDNSSATAQVPRTIGQHLRKRRLQLRLLQSDVALRLGVHKASICNWENEMSEPEIRYIPKIMEFLGYDPTPPAVCLGPQLIKRRTALGLSQKMAAQTLRVDPSTLARWERGERLPAGTFLSKMKHFLEGDINGEMRLTTPTAER